MISQTLKILSYMQGGGTLTGLEALNMFGCMRLGARIWDIKRLGYKIDSCMEIHRDENGKYKAYKRYWLARGNNAA